MSLRNRIERLEREMFPRRHGGRYTLTLQEFEFLYKMGVRYSDNPESVPSFVRQELEEFERALQDYEETIESMQQPIS